MTIVARTSDEFFAVCARERAGELRVYGVERGEVVPDGKHRNGRPKTKRVGTGGTWTFRVSDPPDKLLVAPDGAGG